MCLFLKGSPVISSLKTKQFRKSFEFSSSKFAPKFQITFIVSHKTRFWWIGSKLSMGLIGFKDRNSFFSFNEDAFCISWIWQVNKPVIHFRLEEIEAQNNVLAAIPGTVTKLNDLRYLDVSNNKLKSLPATLNKVFLHIFWSCRKTEAYFRNIFQILKVQESLKLCSTSELQCNIIGGSYRTSLLVVFAFLPQNFGKVVGTYEWYFVTLWVQFWVDSTPIGGGDTWTLTAIIKFVWTFCTNTWWGH